MSDLIQVPRSDWKAMNEIIQIIAANEKANDLVNRKTALEILGIDSKTFSNKKIEADSANEYGQKFYSRRRLLGIKIKK